MSRPYAEVIGDPIAHSKSPLIHNFWLQRLGIDAEYRAIRVRADEVAGYFANRREDGCWRGCNVTMPHKQAVVEQLDAVSRDASSIGAVNTVFYRESNLIGENTDVDGIAEAFAHGRAHVGDYRRHVATYIQVIGTGGAARAAVAVAARTFDFEIYARDQRKAEALAVACGLPQTYGMSLAELGPIRNADDGPPEQRYSHIVVNATPLGMKGHAPLPIDLSHYHADTLVFDMVYDPLETPLLKQARELNLKTVDGFTMLIGQAARAFELFFGGTAPRGHDAELRALLTA